MVLTTANGYVVTFKDESDLTVGDRQKLRRSFIKHMTLNTKTGKPSEELSGLAALDMQEESLRVLLVSIQRPDQKVITSNLLEEVFSWKQQVDADQVFEAIQRVTTPALPAIEKNS